MSLVPNMSLIAYADGENDLIEISGITGASLEKLAEIAVEINYLKMETSVGNIEIGHFSIVA
jgi:aminopeptidase-like protein